MKTLLFKPFEKYSEKNLFLIGLIFTIIGSFIAYFFDIRYDGVFDIHIKSNGLIYQALVDNLINIFCLILFLYLSASYVNKKTRVIDILTTTVIARTPLYILPLFNINNVIGKATEKLIQLVDPKLINQIPASSILLVTVFGIITILFIVWYVALLFNGFKVSSNAKGKVSLILFITSLVLAELLSKFLIFQLN